MREVTAVVDEYGFLEVTSENLIGYVDDENSTLVEVDVSAWATTLPEGVKYSIIMLHPVGSAWPVLSLATPVSGKISFLVVQDSTTLSGTAKMAVSAIASEFQSSTNSVRLRVSGSIAVGEAPTGNPSWITALLAAALNANDVAAAVTAAEVLRAEVESGRVSAEDVRVAAELLRVQNEEARALAESSRSSAEQTRGSNESARQTQESARGVAESGRNTAENGRVAAEEQRAEADAAREPRLSALEDGQLDATSKYAHVVKRMLISPKITDTLTAVYAGVDVGSRAIGLMCKFIWESGTTSGVVAILSNPNGLHRVLDITNKCFHVTLTSTLLVISRYDSGVKTNLLAQTLVTPLSLDGVTEYTLSISVNLTTEVVTATINGETYTVTFSGVAGYLGRYCTLEHFCNGDRANTAMPMYTAWEITGPGFRRAYDHFQRQNGLPAVMPTGQRYVLISNSTNGDADTITTPTGAVDVVTPTWQNSWGPYATLTTTAGYYYDPVTGLVKFFGAISGGTAGSIAFTLPAGIRPAKNRYFCARSGGGSLGTITVNATGTVTIDTFSTWISLDTVSFYVGI